MPPDFNRRVHCLLGLPVDAVDMASTVRAVRQAAREQRRCFLSTPNLNWLVGSLSDPRWRDSVAHSDLSVADGMPLVWIARLLGIPIRERVAGSALFEALRRDASERLGVYLFGGDAGVAETACRRLNSENSGLKCVGFETPGFGLVEELSGEETIARINASGADFLLLSLTARKGQAWIEHNRKRITVPVICHLGATLNFAAGTVKRAPVWMQKTGLEWLWRIMEEPALWRRYFKDGMALVVLLTTRVLPYLLHTRLGGRRAGSAEAPSVEFSANLEDYNLSLRGVWTGAGVDSLRPAFAAAAGAGTNVTLRLEGVSRVDSAFLGLLVLLQGHLRESGRRLRLVGVRRPVRQMMRYCCVEYLLEATG